MSWNNKHKYLGTTLPETLHDKLWAAFDRNFSGTNVSLADLQRALLILWTNGEIDVSQSEIEEIHFDIFNDSRRPGGRKWRE